MTLVALPLCLPLSLPHWEMLANHVNLEILHNVTSCKPTSSGAKSLTENPLSAQLFQQSPPLLQLSWCTVAPKPWNTPFVFVYLSAGDPVCSERLHTVLVLYSQWGWIFFIGDQTDAAERPRPVLHTVGHAGMRSCSGLNSLIIV